MRKEYERLLKEALLAPDDVVGLAEMTARVGACSVVGVRAVGVCVLICGRVGA